MRRTPSRSSGSTLIEVMIAMAVLAVGLLAMWQLHMVGITSTAAARRHTIATALAQELVSGLERLPFSDAHLSSLGVTGSSPSGGVFGQLVDGSGAISASGVHEFDSEPVPGVRTAAEMRESAEVPAGYTRRWTVWDYSTPAAVAAGSRCGVKIIAVSVVWRDPPFARPREVVLYTQVYDPAAFTAALAAGM